MTTMYLQVPSPEGLSPQEYIETKLVPLAQELHRLVNEFTVPGSTQDANLVDMRPSELNGRSYTRLDQRVEQNVEKSVVFSAPEYYSLSTQELSKKRPKVLFTAEVYAQRLTEVAGSVAFRLVRDDGMVVENSYIQTTSETPTVITKQLGFGNTKGAVSPDKHKYFIEARYLGQKMVPVCRRFSLGLILV